MKYAFHPRFIAISYTLRCFGFPNILGLELAHVPR
jgi:hypothetical protein